MGERREKVFSAKGHSRMYHDTITAPRTEDNEFCTGLHEMLFRIFTKGVGYSSTKSSREKSTPHLSSSTVTYPRTSDSNRLDPAPHQQVMG